MGAHPEDELHFSGPGGQVTGLKGCPCLDQQVHLLEISNAFIAFCHIAKHRLRMGDNQVRIASRALGVLDKSIFVVVSAVKDEHNSVFS